MNKTTELAWGERATGMLAEVGILCCAFERETDVEEAICEDVSLWCSNLDRTPCWDYL